MGKMPPGSRLAESILDDDTSTGKTSNSRVSYSVQCVQCAVYSEVRFEIYE
jgi:hypothetical protein